MTGQENNLKFGTSGVRGLVVHLTREECLWAAQAFCEYARSLGHSPKVLLGMDLRESSQSILRAVAEGAASVGFEVSFLGEVPTPALAARCQTLGACGIMVTGSHIPADRNGIKFYFPDREILKKDEEPILSLWRELRGKAHVPDGLDVKLTVEASGFEERYTKFLGYEALKGLKVVFWEHSSVARDMFMRVLRALGAEVMGVGRLNAFTPVDTEAVDNADELAEFIRVNGANALVSTDGDGDRPLLLDENGQMLRGDSIGALVCRLLNADFVATPISSNSLVDEYLGPQVKLVKTKIGSPFVIEEILRARDAGYQRVMGYEANGGFILGSSLSMGGRVIESLMTRDSFLPVLVLLAEASRRGVTLSQLSKELPSRFSESGLLRPLEMEKATLILAKSREIVESLGVGRILDLNVLDGMRYLLEGGKVVHLRPSGNAPEFRIYTEAASSLEAKELLKLAMSCIARA